jgi:hypothetical protein
MRTGSPLESRERTISLFIRRQSIEPYSFVRVKDILDVVGAVLTPLTPHNVMVKMCSVVDLIECMREAVDDCEAVMARSNLGGPHFVAWSK